MVITEQLSIGSGIKFTEIGAKPGSASRLQNPRPSRHRAFVLASTIAACIGRNDDNQAVPASVGRRKAVDWRQIDIVLSAVRDKRGHSYDDIGFAGGHARWLR